MGEAGTTGRVPSRRVSPCTLLSYEGSFPSRWPQRREEEGGWQVHLYGEAARDFFFPSLSVGAGAPVW